MGEEQLTWVDPLLIDPNPFQPKTRITFTPAQLVDLEDVKERGLLQKFKVRYSPVEFGRYQQAFGHRRLAAWLLHRPGEPIPVVVVALTEREMFEHMVAENADRADLSSIEQAELIAAYLDQFKEATQAQAGELFNLRTQGAVSNKLSLLKLPAEIRDLIQGGVLPERLARALRSLASIDAKAAVTAAKVIAKREPDERDGALYELLDAYVDKHGESLRWVPWKSLDWPGKPIPSAIGDIPKCLGCTYNVRCDAGDPEDRGCINRTCYAAKLKAWAESEASRVAEKAGIAVAGPREKLVILYDGSDWKKREFAQLALSTKHASLRTVAVYVKTRGSYGLDSVSGSDYVIIATTDLPALRKAVAEKSKEPKQPKVKPKLERWEIAQKAREKEKRERAKQIRTLLSNAAPAFAPVIPPALMELLYHELRFDLPGRTTGDTDRAWRKASVDERGRMIAEVLLKKHVGFASYSVPGVDVVSKKVVGLARVAHVKLPRGWNVAASTNSQHPAKQTKQKGAKRKR